METKKTNNIISFTGGNTGSWKILSMTTIAGESLQQVQKLNIRKGKLESENVVWTLNGVISNMRYTNRNEKTELDKNAIPLDSPAYDYAALIPIKKSDAWWAMTQDERRKIFEEDSRHIGISMGYLSVISRQLHHSRDLGEEFDFLTWFRFPSKHTGLFDELVEKLRGTEEWKYVVREIDIRVLKTD